MKVKRKEGKKAVGEHKIKGVEKLKKLLEAKKKKKQEKDKGFAPKKKIRATGAKGGVFHFTATGKKIYDSSMKKALEELKTTMTREEQLVEMEDMIRKSLFPKESERVLEYKPSKEDEKKWAINSIVESLEKLNELEECRYTIEKEFPEEKDVFEEVYSKIKKEVNKAISEYKKLV